MPDDYNELYRREDGSDVPLDQCTPAELLIAVRQLQSTIDCLRRTITRMEGDHDRTRLAAYQHAASVVAKLT